MKRIWLPVCLLAACSEKEPPKPEVVPRPVSVIELRESDPVQSLLLTGSVRSWAEQDVAFEVEGVVRFSAEAGTNLEGRFLTADGEVQVEGDPLAQLDSQAYEIARSTAVATVEVAKENLDTAHVELAKVLPASLKAAEANQVRAQAEHDQIDALYKKGAAPEVDLIRARADRDGRVANVEEALAAMDAKKAEIKSLEARVQQAEESLRQADYDLARCRLVAPFAGEVAEVYVEAGGYARRGQPVVHLVMMQPVLVDLAVSDETAARLSRGDGVRVRVRGLKEMAYARVYDKATSADPETRTFRVSIIVRNERVRAPFGADDPRAKPPHITDTLPMRRLEDSGPYLVEAHGFGMCVVHFHRPPSHAVGHDVEVEATRDQFPLVRGRKPKHPRHRPVSPVPHFEGEPGQLAARIKVGRVQRDGGAELDQPSGDFRHEHGDGAELEDVPTIVIALQGMRSPPRVDPSRCGPELKTDATSGRRRTGVPQSQDARIIIVEREAVHVSSYAHCRTRHGVAQYIRYGPQDHVGLVRFRDQAVRRLPRVPRLRDKDRIGTRVSGRHNVLDPVSQSGNPAESIRGERLDVGGHLFVVELPDRRDLLLKQFDGHVA